VNKILRTIGIINIYVIDKEQRSILPFLDISGSKLK